VNITDNFLQPITLKIEKEAKKAMCKILIVEDEINISSLLRTHLEHEGYQCFQVYDGLSALNEFNRIRPDLIILDLMLPGKNGLEVCKTIRESNDTYILMLTAKQEEIDRVLGLELGADDYMIKPFSVRELLARVRALLRRPHLLETRKLAGPAIVLGELEIKPAQMQLYRSGERIPLTALEFDLLYFLMKNAGIVFKRDQLLRQIWENDSDVYDRSIDQIISQLRKKIEDNPAEPRKIVTVWGVGYKFDENS
jgi:two-component system alkaline phosphatase synthesis response regulator PhoP